MTALQLYAISDSELRHLPEGAAGEELVQITAAGLVAVAGRSGTPASALDFARVVESLANNGAALPARHGEGFADERALRTAVTANASSLHRTLEQVRDCIEMGISAAFSEPLSDPIVACGSDYLKARAANLHLIERLVADVHEPLTRLARNARLQHAHAPLRFSAAYLVPRQSLGAFRRHAEQLARTCTEATLVVTGPWPPYSFTAVEEKR